MKVVYTDAHRQHNPPFEIYDDVKVPYAETAARAEVIIATIREQQIGPIVSPRDHALRYIEAIHLPEYVRSLRRHSQQLDTNGVLYPSYFMSDTYAPVTPGTFAAARAAVDAALTGADLLLHEEAAVYSLCRPPGHHAAHHSMGGYCYFNNAAIAANYLSAHGRVAILDIDYHHGNGTQDAFYDRADVLYVSLHADPATAYPYGSGFAHETGRGKGRGFTVNVPLPKTTNDADYLRVLRTALGYIKKFAPEYLIVSAGFDTFIDDPIGGLRLTHHAYSSIGKAIAGLSLPTMIIQEGGYNVSHLGSIVGDFLKQFQG